VNSARVQNSVRNWNLEINTIDGGECAQGWMYVCGGGDGMAKGSDARYAWVRGCVCRVARNITNSTQSLTVKRNTRKGNTPLFDISEASGELQFLGHECGVCEGPASKRNSEKCYCSARTVRLCLGHYLAHFPGPKE